MSTMLQKVRSQVAPNSPLSTKRASKCEILAAHMDEDDKNRTYCKLALENRDVA